MIKDYFSKLEDQIGLFQDIIRSYTITTKYYNRYKGYIIGNIVFVNGSQLRLKEVKDTGFYRKEKYSYHYMDSENLFLFRYDNANHFPEIETFPHHKHLPDNVMSTDEPNLVDVLIEISELLLRK